jgi:hypothetical protein
MRSLMSGSEFIIGSRDNYQRLLRMLSFRASDLPRTDNFAADQVSDSTTYRPKAPLRHLAGLIHLEL